MSSSKELFDQGLKTRREVVGDVYVDRSLQNGSSEFAFPGQQLVTEYDSTLPLQSDHSRLISSPQMVLGKYLVAPRPVPAAAKPPQ